MTKNFLLKAWQVFFVGIVSFGFVAQTSAQPDFGGLWLPANFDPNAPRLQPGSNGLPFNEAA
jgi:hypothetical protein